ncbi:MAG: MFS transporter [Proteobacteria bacterium]|nr:MFS transporter [Pseudomonadota bacterium]
MKSDNRQRQFATIVTVIGVAYAMSQFYRMSNGVIAKELSAEFSLSAEALGGLTGVFFVSFAVAQIPLGMLFDRFGVRRTLPVILTFAVAGAVTYGLAGGFASLLAGRLMMGLGVSGVLVGALFVFGRWVPAERYATWMGRMIAIGGIGVLLSTTPLGLIAESVGWRYAFYGAGAVTALGALLIFLLVRDSPLGREPDIIKPEGLKESVTGVIEVLKTPRLPTVMGMAFASYPVLTAIVGLWGGPYLIDVYGLDTIASGNILLIMAVALIIGNIAYGPLEERLDTRKWLVAGSAALVLISFLLLALIPRPPLALATALFVLISFCSAYNIVIAGHGRALFPDRLAGRGIAMIAIALMGGPAIVQSASGLIMGAFPQVAGASPTDAYRAVFGFLAAIVLLALLAYLRLPDVRPSAGFATDLRADTPLPEERTAKYR